MKIKRTGQLAACITYATAQLPRQIPVAVDGTSESSSPS